MTSKNLESVLTCTVISQKISQKTFAHETKY